MFKRFLVTICLLISFQAWSCKLTQENPWFWDSEKLLNQTPNVYLARVVGAKVERKKEFFPFNTDYTFKVICTIKGDPLKTFIISGGEPLPKNSDEKLPTYHKDCRLLASFEKDQAYVIFKNSFNKNGYRKIRLDPWLEEIFSKQKGCILN